MISMDYATAWRRGSEATAAVAWLAAVVLGADNIASPSQEIVLAAIAATASVVACLMRVLPDATTAWRRGAAAMMRATRDAGETGATVTDLRRATL